MKSETHSCEKSRNVEWIDFDTGKDWGLNYFGPGLKIWIMFLGLEWIANFRPRIAVNWHPMYVRREPTSWLAQSLVSEHLQGYAISLNDIFFVVVLVDHEPHLDMGNSNDKQRKPAGTAVRRNVSGVEMAQEAYHFTDTGISGFTQIEPNHTVVS